MYNSIDLFDKSQLVFDFQDNMSIYESIHSLNMTFSISSISLSAVISLDSPNDVIPAVDPLYHTLNIIVNKEEGW